MEEAVGKGGRSLISARKEKGGPTSDAVRLPLLRAREGAAETNNCLGADAWCQATPPRGHMPRPLVPTCRSIKTSHASPGTCEAGTSGSRVRHIQRSGIGIAIAEPLNSPGLTN